jgi:hypothetical protein
MSEICVGGWWPAVESFIVFIFTNIVTHAVSVVLPSGADVKFQGAMIFSSILLPAHLGDYAFRLLGRWWRHLSSRWAEETSLESKLATLAKSCVGGESLEDAVMAGALAIYVPPEYHDLLTTRWNGVRNFQKVVISEKDICFTKVKGYDKGRKHPRVLLDAKRGRKTPFFVLPPNTKLNKKGEYVLTPTSSLLPQAIAIFQMVVSARQLWINYDTSIAVVGLASPYLIVIPYIIMTLLNFVAKGLVGSYPQVVLLPNPRISMAEYRLNGTSEEVGSEKRIEDFKSWLKDHYGEEIENIEDEDLYRESKQMAAFVSTIYCVTGQTLFIGLLTHFRLGIPSHAAWYLIWVYFPSIMRHIMGRMGKIRISVQRPFWKLRLMLIPFNIITIVMGIGWMGGLTVLEVELMEAMCQTTWSLSVRVWILVGSMAYLGVTLLYLAGGSIILIFGNP